MMACPSESPLLDESPVSADAQATYAAPAHPLLTWMAPLIADLPFVDPAGLLRRVLAAARPDADHGALRELLIHTAASLTFEEPEYSQLAARALAEEIHEEVEAQGVDSFLASIQLAHDVGVVNARVLAFVTEHSAALESAVRDERDRLFE